MSVASRVVLIQIQLFSYPLKTKYRCSLVQPRLVLRVLVIANCHCEWGRTIVTNFWTLIKSLQHTCRIFMKCPKLRNLKTCSKIWMLKQTVCHQSIMLEILSPRGWYKVKYSWSMRNRRNYSYKYWRNRRRRIPYLGTTTMNSRMRMIIGYSHTAILLTWSSRH